MRGRQGWERASRSRRSGLERLLRYCARPPFALERLEQLTHDQLVYRFPKPQPDGRTQLHLTPLELIERLAALIPPPRIHRDRTVKTILAHLGEPTTPPEVARARGPPLWEQLPEPMGHWDEAPAPVPQFVFDQRVSW